MPRPISNCAERQPLAAFLWGFLDGRPQIHERRSFKEVPAETELSKRISKALKAEGFRFVGPTTVYAFMQSTGMVNDHSSPATGTRPAPGCSARFEAP